jgi:peroxiredoxin Q/BCP
VQILGASFDTVEANKTFAENNNFPYPLLCDTDHVLGRAYGAGDSGLPSRITYVIDENGLIAHAFPQVNTGTHAEDILTLVQA